MIKKLYDNRLALNTDGWNGIVSATTNGPSLLPAYEYPYFKENVEFFNCKPIFSLFDNIFPYIPPVLYTNDYDRKLCHAANVQAAVLLDEKRYRKGVSGSGQSLA